MVNVKEIRYMHRLLKSLRLGLVLSISFFDYLAFAIIIPHTYSLILSGPDSLLSAGTSDPSRYITLGALLATYPLMQALGNPILGAIADAISRKRVLLISFIGNFIGYALSAYAIYSHNIFYLFLGNGLAGLTGGNISTINAVIADLSENRQKARRFSYSIMTFGLAFIVGPFISGQLSAHMPLITIYALSASISIFNFLLLGLLFHDLPKGLGLQRLKPHFIGKDLREVFQSAGSLKHLFLAVFSLYLGWYFFIKFFRVLLLDRLHYSLEQYCNILSYFGICCLIAQGLYSLYCSRLREESILKIIAPLLALSILSLAFISSLWTVLTAVTLFSICYAILCPTLTYIVSEAGHALAQGRIMGLFQAVHALAQVFGPALAGFSMAAHPMAPIFISCVLILSGSWIFSKTAAPQPT